MDERLEKLLKLIQTLPAEQIVIIAEKCKWLGEVSPKVQKLLDIFNKLSDDEKQQFLKNVQVKDGWSNDVSTTDDWESEPECDESMI